MKHNHNLKKSMAAVLITVAIFLVVYLALRTYEYHTYTANTNLKLITILNSLSDRYPDISNIDKAKLINMPIDPEAYTFSYRLGINTSHDSLVAENAALHSFSMVAEIIILCLMCISIIGIFVCYNHRKDRELKKISNYLEQLNLGNYSLEIDDMSEDELSILKCELYKTTVMLKESSTNSLSDKMKLKESLSDISHQLKTPLTSILVTLDNLTDHPDMDAQTRIHFIRDIKREITNIQFLVQSLLKLSRLESNTVIFIRKNITTWAIVSKALQNVSVLCDLKDISINLSGTDEHYISCDERWQVEAVTNIIKNCIEHSFNGSKLDINLEQNHLYTSITIRDYGTGIDEEDKNHLFERFYRGKNASYDSCGIGLSLAKAIIEANNGSISVDSYPDGTAFTIRYYH